MVVRYPCGMATTILTTAASEWEATVIVEALRDAGIDASVSGVLTSSFRAEAPGRARILVPEAQEADALAALERIRTEAKNIDWDQVDVGESTEPEG